MSDTAIEALRYSEFPNSSDCISRQAAISHVDDVPYIKDHPNVGLLWKAWIESLPSAQPETCEGCKHSGKWEDEVENGYPSPCTRCKRRVGDHYER